MTADLTGIEAQRLLDAATPGELAWESVGTQDNEWCIGVTDPEVSGQIVEPYDEATDTYGELPMVVESLAFNGVNATFADAEMFCAVKRALRRVVALEAERDALEAENTRLAAVASQAAQLTLQRNHHRERATSLGARVDWMQSVAAAAMRQGLAACRALRSAVARREAERDALALQLRDLQAAVREYVVAAHARRQMGPDPGEAAREAVALADARVLRASTALADALEPTTP